MSMRSDATTQNVGIPLRAARPRRGRRRSTPGTQYAIPNRRVTAKSLPLWDTFFKTSALRAPHCPQTCFASEQLVDELAHAARIDPYEFRLQNIATAQVNDGFGQWRDVLTAVAEPRRLGAARRRARASQARTIVAGPRDRDRRFRQLAGRRSSPRSR